MNTWAEWRASLLGLSIAEIQVGSIAVVKCLPYNSLGGETGEGVGYLDIFWIDC